MQKAVEILSQFLANTSNAEVLRQIISHDATYVSLNFENPDLTAIMPWCGTHKQFGPEAVVKTFADVGWYWEILAFEPTDVFGDDIKAAAFGSFTYKSRKLQQTVTSPFAVYIRLNGEALVEYMQFMEDTFATAMSFRKNGTWHIESNPDGGSVDVDLQTAKELFERWDYYLAGPYGTTPQSFRDLRVYNWNRFLCPGSNMSTVFLNHAKLYGFAESRLLPNLSSTALEKIFYILKDHSCEGDGLTPVLDLVEYAFNVELFPGMDGKPGRLQDLLLDYLVGEAADILGVDAFTD